MMKLRREINNSVTPHRLCIVPKTRSTTPDHSTPVYRLVLKI